MYKMLSGVLRVLAPVAASAAMLLFAAQPAVAQVSDAVTVTAPHARIVSIHRSRVATAYERRFDRVSDDGYDWWPSGYREIVRVVIEIDDPDASRVDADERPQRVIVELDPDQLNAAQSAALMNRRMSRRVAAFQLIAARTTSIERQIDRRLSYACGNDEMFCEDRAVYREAPVERVQYSVI